MIIDNLRSILWKNTKTLWKTFVQYCWNALGISLAGPTFWYFDPTTCSGGYGCLAQKVDTMFIHWHYSICNIYIYNVHIQYIWYMSQYMIYFPSFAAGRDTVTDLWSRSLFRRSCGCGLCWSLAAADGSIQAKKFLGQSMEIFHGDPLLLLGQLDMSGTISTEISTLITEIGMLHSHSGWAGTAPVVIRKPYSQSNCTLKISQLIFTMSLIDSCW